MAVVSPYFKRSMVQIDYYKVTAYTVTDCWFDSNQHWVCVSVVFSSFSVGVLSLVSPQHQLL